MIAVAPGKEWLTAAEAAAEGLPGYPQSERGARDWLIDAIENGIKWRRRSGRGGGREFHWASLPREAREEYLKRHGAALTQSTETEPEVRDALRSVKADARRLIADAAHRFIAERNLPIGKGLKKFCALYARRKAGCEPFAYEAEPHPTPAAIRAWDRKIRTRGAGALIDRRGRPEGTSTIAKDDALNAYIVAQIASRPHLSAPALKRAIAADLSREIPLRTLQAFMAGFRAANKGVLKALTDPDAHRSHHTPAFGNRSAAATFINALWEIDATRADAMCRVQGGERRMTLTAAIDVFSRRAMVLVSDQPRAMATAALLRRAILAWGIPAKVKLDNGKEFTARAVVSFCADLGIEIEYSRPFSPEEKPHIERFFGTLNRGLFPLLPGFTGHNIAQRQAIEHRKSFAHRFGEEARLVLETSLAPEELQAQLDAYLRNIYEREIHGGLNRTPFEIALAHGAEARRVENERALDALLFPAPDASGLRTVGKKGVRVGNSFYVAPELGALAARAAKVLVKLDPHEPGRAVIYSADNRSFLCVAEDSQTIEDARLVRIAAEAKANARREIATLRKSVAKVQRLFPADGLGARILGQASGGIDLTPDAREAMIAADTPRAMIEHAKAVEALAASKEAAQPIEVTPEQEEGGKEYFAVLDVKRRAPEIKILHRDGYDLPDFEREVDDFIYLEDLVEAGTVLEPIDAVRLAEYRASDSMQMGLRIERGIRARVKGGA